MLRNLYPFVLSIIIYATCPSMKHIIQAARKLAVPCTASGLFTITSSDCVTFQMV